MLVSIRLLTWKSGTGVTNLVRIEVICSWDLHPFEEVLFNNLESVIASSSKEREKSERVSRVCRSNWGRNPLIRQLVLLRHVKMGHERLQKTNLVPLC